MLSKVSLVERTPTGIPGLDEVIGGGFPKGRVILLVGGPGTGKTILCSQFLINGINKYEENGIFVSLDEAKYHLYKEMAIFGFKLNELEKQKKFSFIDASPIRNIPGDVKLGKLTIGKRDFSIVSLVEVIRANAEMINAKRIAIDPVTSFIFQYPDTYERRMVILDLVEAFTEIGATCIMTTELRQSKLEREMQLEEYLAHGVIVLQTLPIGRSNVRVLHVEKMRETQIDLQSRPYKITEQGIQVFPKETIYED